MTDTTAQTAANFMAFLWDTMVAGNNNSASSGPGQQPGFGMPTFPRMGGLAGPAVPQTDGSSGTPPTPFGMNWWTFLLFAFFLVVAVVMRVLTNIQTRMAEFEKRTGPTMRQVSDMVHHAFTEREYYNRSHGPGKDRRRRRPPVAEIWREELGNPTANYDDADEEEEQASPGTPHEGEQEASNYSHGHGQQQSYKKQRPPSADFSGTSAKSRGTAAAAAR